MFNTKDASKFRQLTPEESMLLIAVQLNLTEEAKNTPIPEKHKHPIIKILEIRIEQFNLPIKFTTDVWMLIHMWANSPGRGITFLIDCLRSLDGSDELYEAWKEDPTKLVEEPVVVDMDHICMSVYPYGVYTETAIDDYVENYLKNNKVPWAELY